MQMRQESRKVKFDEEDGNNNMQYMQDDGMQDDGNQDHYYDQDQEANDGQQQQYNQAEMRSRPSDMDSLNFGSYKSKGTTGKIAINDTQSQRTHNQMVNEVFSKSKQITREMSRYPLDEINLTFTNQQQDQMRQFTNDLFDFLADDKNENGKLDWTELKAYMYMANVQYSNPTLFKKINDEALKSGQEGQMDKKQFSDLILNDGLLKMDMAKKEGRMPPDVMQIAELFEFLDEDRTGMISGKDLMSFLETSQRLKLAQFDYERYSQQLNVTPQDLERTLNLMRKEVDELIQAFDLTGDSLVGPEEFFNVIMYAYDALV